MHSAYRWSGVRFGALLGLVLATSAATGCASTPKPKSERHAKKTSDQPKNYSLYEGSEINQALLRRGEQQMVGPALDEY